MTQTAQRLFRPSILNALRGLMMGAVLGEFAQTLIYLNFTVGGHRYFPIEGLACGAALGFVLGLLLGGTRKGSRLFLMSFWIFAGAFFGAMLGSLIGMFLLANVMDHAGFTIALVLLGCLGGTVAGGVIGFARRHSE